MIYNHHRRSELAEKMDDPDLPEEELAVILNDINRVNKLLGGLLFSLNAVKKAIAEINTAETITIMDLGCGDGTLLRYLDDHIAQKNVSFIGIDLNAKSINRAKKLTSSSRISYVQEDIRKVDKSQESCDILISMLTFHHLDDTEIVGVLNVAKQIVSHKIIINDLHRHFLAYLSFKIVSPILLEHAISKYDGLVSIASAFKTKDFKQYATSCGLYNYSVDWKWSFRYIWTIDL